MPKVGKAYTSPDDAMGDAAIYSMTTGERQAVWWWPGGVYTVHPAHEPVCAECDVVGKAENGRRLDYAD